MGPNLVNVTNPESKTPLVLLHSTDALFLTVVEYFHLALIQSICYFKNKEIVLIFHKCKS